MDECHNCDNLDNMIIAEGKDSAVADQDMASMFTLDADINGTVDPNIHLSQYDSIPDKYHKVESQVSSSDNAKSKLRRNAVSSKNSGQVSSVSCRNVVFDGKPKKTTKNLRSGRNALKNEEAEVKHVEQDSFLEMCEGNVFIK